MEIAEFPELEPRRVHHARPLFAPAVLTVAGAVEGAAEDDIDMTTKFLDSELIWLNSAFTFKL